jgi:hypothetical protein
MFVLCMQSDRDIHRTAREGSLSQTRTGHAIIVALVTATCLTVHLLSRGNQASRPGLLRQRGGEVAGRVRCRPCSIAVGTHAGALPALATN